MPLEFLAVKEKEAVKEVENDTSEQLLASLLELIEKKTPLIQVKQWITVIYLLFHLQLCMKYTMMIL